MMEATIHNDFLRPNFWCGVMFEIVFEKKTKKMSKF